MVIVKGRGEPGSGGGYVGRAEVVVKLAVVGMVQAVVVMVRSGRDACMHAQACSCWYFFAISSRCASISASRVELAAEASTPVKSPLLPGILCLHTSIESNRTLRVRERWARRICGRGGIMAKKSKTTARRCRGK